MVERPHIPEGVLRQVRQRDGFGCIFCGDLLVEYHHIIPFSKCKEHDPKNLTLLCKRCHDEVTSKRRGTDQVLSAYKNPYCKRGNNHPHYWFYSKGQAELCLGNNKVRFQNPGYCQFGVVRLSKNCFIDVKIEDGVPFINADIPDKLGRVAVRIRDNRIALRNRSIWDARLKGQRFDVRMGSRRFLVRAKIADGIFDFSLCRMLGSHAALKSDKNGMKILKGGSLDVISFHDCDFGTSLASNGSFSVIMAEGQSGDAFNRINTYGALDPKDGWNWLFKK